MAVVSLLINLHRFDYKLHQHTLGAARRGAPPQERSCKKTEGLAWPQISCAVAHSPKPSTESNHPSPTSQDQEPRDAKAQRGELTCLRTHSQLAAKRLVATDFPGKFSGLLIMSLGRGKPPSQDELTGTALGAVGGPPDTAFWAVRLWVSDIPLATASKF